MSEFKFLCSVCGRKFPESEGGVQCPLCQRIFCVNCMADYPIRKVEVRKKGPDYKRYQYMCKLCEDHWIHTKVLYNPLEDHAGIKSLTVLKEVIDKGNTACNWCEWYLDKRVSCWKRFFPDGCNQFELSPKIIEAFRTHGLIDKRLGP